MDNNAILTIRALDGLSARATATSENIANANTRGYRPLRVNFEDALRKAALDGADALETFKPVVARAPTDLLPNGGALRLDLEMGSASMTALRYGALISVLGRELELQSLAVKRNYGIMKAMEISRTGLDVEWRRLEVISENLANVNTARNADGTAFQARQLISGPRGGFATYLTSGSETHAAGGVEVYGIETVPSAPRMVYEPHNPQADANGMVSYPAIDQSAQMTLMIKTSRAYQSNIVAMNAAQEMYSRALELGNKS